MPHKKTAIATAKGAGSATVEEKVKAVLAWLERQGSKANRDGMARYGIVAAKVFGVSVANLQLLAKSYRRDHQLAAALWKTGWYEARMLSALVDDPAQVTPAQMERWARGFDNWAICDTVCFHLFDRTPHAWDKVAAWADRSEEFVRRASFALLAGLTVHDKQAADDRYAAALSLVERAALDPRNFVKKAVNWALRSIGKRSLVLHAQALEVAGRLAAAPEAAPRWVGKDALRELSGAAVRLRLEARAGRRAAGSARTRPPPRS